MDLQMRSNETAIALDLFMKQNEYFSNWFFAM